jgi:hypothetical protein
LAISNEITKLEYVGDALQGLMEISLNQIHISYASHRDSFPLARPIYDAQAPIQTEYEQRVIVKFLFNEGLDPRQIVEKLETQFHEGAYSLRAVQCWIGEVRRGREDLHDETRPGSSSEEHITAKIQELLNYRGVHKFVACPVFLDLAGFL